MQIYKEQDSIIFENKNAKIMISSDNAMVKSVTDKVNLKEIKGEDSCFFYLIKKDKKNIALPNCLTLNDSIITVSTELGDFKIKCNLDEEYFSFELLSVLPEDSYKLVMAHCKYNYDYSDKKNSGAIGVALTYWANPCFYPDAKSLETKAEVTSYLKDVGAKYALIVAPINQHKEIIKKASLTIDKRYGIVTKHGGAWGQDSPLNYGNTIIPDHNSEEFVNERMELFKTLGLSHIDFHKGNDSFYQGDFKYVHFKDGEDFKNRVVKRLEENDMYAGIHTYTAYIDYECDSILSNPKWQKQLNVLGEYTLSGDIDENAMFLPTVESTDSISTNFGFSSQNTPYILVGCEIMEFENASGGFNIKERALRTTKAASYKKGEKIYHLDGYYQGIHPIPGSELFYEVARNTARAFNEGGYKCIYLDALEGTIKHCTDRDDAWFYIAGFVCEILAHCDIEPMVECSSSYPYLWPVRGRFGAYDTPAKGYKHWNRMHVKNNEMFSDMFATTTLGWYDFYPVYKDVPANINTKYHHTDDAHHLGSLSVMHDLSMVYNEIDNSITADYPAFFRNVAIYRTYDDLRRKKYFSDDVLQKVRSGEYEYHIKEVAPGDYAFVEKDYQLKRIHSLNDAMYCCEKYSNPFGKQTPFIRIEALLSATDENPITVFDCDSKKELTQQSLEYKFEHPTDLSHDLAKRVRVWGNGKKGAIAFVVESIVEKERGVLKYYIDTDFEGMRDFILLETDNGMRPDLLFDGDVRSGKTCNLKYADYRAEISYDKVTKVSVLTSGDVSGVKMSPVVATKHSFEIIKNPSVCVGGSKITFLCELGSTEYIEYDGKTAKLINEFGNEKTIEWIGNICVPEGSFEAKLICENTSENPLRAQLTFGFEGKIIS